MYILATILIIFAVILLIFLLSYQKLMQVRQESENAWKQIEMLTTKRYEMVPQLIEMVKDKFQDDKKSLDAVMKMRQQAMKISANDKPIKAELEDLLTQTIKSLFHLLDNQEELKDHSDFQGLKRELLSYESKINFARQFYNDCVYRLNQKVEKFPSSILARFYEVKKAQYFEMEEATMVYNVSG